jgi:hypothetical protein
MTGDEGARLPERTLQPLVIAVAYCRTSISALKKETDIPPLPLALHAQATDRKLNKDAPASGEFIKSCCARKIIFINIYNLIAY